MKKIDLIDQPVRPCNFNDFYYFKNHFNDEKIEAIHEMVRRGGYKFEKGGTGYGEKEKIDHNYSNNRDIAYVPGDPNSWWLYNELEKLTIQANNKMFQFDIQYVTDPLHYVIYPEPNKPGKTGETREQGGYLDWHMDIGQGEVNRRKLALTVQLSDPKDYEGGVFQCWFGGGGRFIDLPRQKGDVLVMPSFIMHNVSPITKGERRALVFWTGGEPFK